MENNTVLLMLTFVVWVGTLLFALNYILSQKKKYDKLEKETLTLHTKLTAEKERAITDELTGIYNRRHIYELLEHELNRAKRHQRHMQVLFLDVDNFKLVNDYYGHDIGDMALQQIAKTLTNHLRNFDIYGRFGGDEFVIILPEATKFHANIVAERISLDVKEMAIKSITTASLGASIGISSFNPENPKHQDIKASDLLNKADAEMYKQKRARKKSA